MSKVLARSFIGIAFALATATVAANPAAGPNATLTGVTGKVSVNQGSEFVPAQPEMRLKPGDRVMFVTNAYTIEL